jgi:murein DD-endopeptidase MepM/ murein hydrolase activator NlpD
VFVKDSKNRIHDLSRFTTAGSITRRINQVSSANVTLRNPNRMFTDPAIFRPMDPITIYLERLKGHPVRVFTGFLDKVPFYQMYPGTISIEASCTLKKLLFTFFDPALPYTQSFLKYYGWMNKGGAVYSKRAVDRFDGSVQDILNSGAYHGEDLNDGSVGELLWATLHHIGGWADQNIYIEKLPKGIIERVSGLYKEFAADNKQIQKEFEDLMSTIIGEASYGDGGGTGNVDLAGVDGTVAEQVYEVGTRMKAPHKLMVAAFETGLVESGMQNLDHGDKDSLGWRQERASLYKDPMNVPNSAKRFFEEGLSVLNGANPHGAGVYQDSWTAGHLAQAIQGSANPDAYDQRRADAMSLLQQTRKKKNGADDSNDNSSSANPPDESDTQTKRSSKSSSKSGGGKYSEYSPPFPKGTHYVPGRIDQGWDIEEMPVGTKVLSMTDGEVIAVPNNEVGGDPHNGGGFGPNYPVIKCTSGPLEGKIFYYGHVNPCHVKPGDKVKAGDHIADIQKINNVGGSGGHIEIGFWPLGDMQAGTAVKPVIQSIFDGGTDFPSNDNSSSSSSGDPTGDITSTAAAAAVAGVLQFPSLLESMEANALQGQKSLLNDKPLMPFIQQMTDASLRSFQSLPNGDFFAFYPDYFGEFGHHNPYWLIDDIEILDGGIDLTDDNLCTHYFAVGDTTGVAMGAGNPMLNAMLTAGVVNIFNVFQSEKVTTKAPEESAMAGLLEHDEAIAFLKRYGARPLTEDLPMIRSPFFEMFVAYQRFLLAWSRQFLTPFTFTFMPELYPGGKVGFPDHGLQMYIDEVTHSWDYTSGFFTQANLSAPAAMVDSNGKPMSNNLPPYMVKAMADPVLTTTPRSTGKTPAEEQYTEQMTKAATNAFGALPNTGNLLGTASGPLSENIPGGG